MPDRWLKIVMPIVRTVLGATFVLSGFVKAVDPRGFGYKLEEYMQAVGLGAPEWLNLPLVLAVALCCAEFVLGVYLLLGIRRKFAAWATLAVSVVFAIIAVWLVIDNPVSDCGCFGDAVSLSNAATLLKNVVLLGLAVLLVRYPLVAGPVVRNDWQWLASLVSCVFIFVFALRSVYYLPLIDFRQYKIGANLREMVFPTHDDIRPEDISDFMAMDTLGQDMTADILFDEGATMLVVSPRLNEAKASGIADLADIRDWCGDRGYKMYCLTASPQEEIRQWQYYNDVEYPVLMADHTLLKTMVRSNPGLILLRNGVIRNKWSANALPAVRNNDVSLAQLEQTAGRGKRTLWLLLLGYVAAMIALTTLSRIPRKKHKHTNLKIKQTMRKKIVAGNWKMNMTLPEGVALAKELNEMLKADKPNCEVVICTPFIHLATVAPLLDTSVLKLGAENCADKEKGAYTGEVSAAMVKSTGAEYVILGHSERRAYYGETPEILKEKVNLALANGLKVIFCIGEVLEEREAGKQNEVVAAQLKGSLYDLTAEQFANIVLAYEPVWAIGTGKTATAEQAEEMHAFIRAEIAKQFGTEVAENTTIQYGGSCKPSNAKELFAKPDVDGGLIGGASLKAADFKGIIDAWK